MYNGAQVTIIILGNGTTAMTGHQERPGTGISAQGKEAGAGEPERLIRGIGVEDVRVVNAFDMIKVRDVEVLVAVDGTGKTGEPGAISTLNVFMLGCVAHFLPVGFSLWRDCISQRLPSKILQENQENLATFDRAREEVSRVSVG